MVQFQVRIRTSNKTVLLDTDTFYREDTTPTEANLNLFLEKTVTEAFATWALRSGMTVKKEQISDYFEREEEPEQKGNPGP